jgi:hypothetical protein
MLKTHISERAWLPHRVAYGQLALYLAFGVASVLLIVGLLTTAWLWQVKDWGVTADSTGRILVVAPGSAAAAAGIVPNDYISFDDFLRLKQLAGEVPAGDLLSLPVRHSVQQRIVTLQARESDLPRKIGLCVITWVGMGFVLVGAAPLIARRRNFMLWLFFICSQITGLFLIVEVPRSLNVFWAELASFIALPLFPAALIHFHTLFPRPKLGRWRGPLVIAVYALATALIPVALIPLWDHQFFYSGFWQTTTQIYIVGGLLVCLALLVHAYITTTDRLVRSQLKIITLCSGAGLTVNAILLGIYSWFSRDVAIVLENLAVTSALQPAYRRPALAPVVKQSCCFQPCADRRIHARRSPHRDKTRQRRRGCGNGWVTGVCRHLAGCLECDNR